MRATIKDVAAAAGVSIKTVSRVLNNERYVGAQTRERVSAVVAELGFRPSPPARTLSARPAGLVAVFHETGAGHDLPQLLAGVQARCAAADLHVVTVPCDGDVMEREDARALIDALQPASAILLPPLGHHRPLRTALAERGVRTLLVSPDDTDATPTVATDEARAGAVMTRHLLALGHRRIGFVGAVASRRARGHRAALSAAGIGGDDALFVAAVDDFAAGARAGATLLELAEPPTAVFAGSDTLAAGVLTAAHARGLRVPEDVSVAGYGDEALAGYVWPPLTTVRVSARAMGEAAADLLLQKDDGVREIGFDLVERASVIGIGI